MAETPTLLRVLTLQRHWQVYETFRLRFEATASSIAETENDPRLRGLSVSKRQFERWYGGAVKTRPYPDQCRVLEAMFGVSVDLLLAPAPPASPPAPAVDPPLVIPPPRPAPVLLATEQAAAPSAGGPFSSETRFDAGPTELERQVTMAARRALRFTAMAEGSSIGPETLSQIHDEVRRLTVAYPRLALPTLLGDLVEVQDLTFRLLEHGRVKPLQARELYLLAGITSGMLAKASHDLGNPSAAMMQARTAFVCADNADHHAMRAWVRSLQSLISYWAGRPAEAADYATLGQSVAGNVRGTTSVWLACLSARAHALLGDGESTRSAIQQVENARAAVELDDLDAFGGIMTFPVPRQLYYVAEATMHLGEDAVLGESQAEAAVTAYRNAAEDEWAFGDEAGAQTDLALARIARNEIEGAIEAIRPVLDLPTEQRNFGITSSTQRVHAALHADARQGGMAAGLREEIEAFTATPTSALIR
ncbi:hypothetical protein [Streptomyces meridianus]|uniref:XRE family transcriptional regulator n=1 Tax=Streptomyces meridianus TaxID=2938945 RepID=A0ABT0XB34_9ACTN|nr:hypothetical protein [Streptomyces meridianus]MCM2579736.1 hypothetical protein [Streptomyces meridianus]